MVSKDRILQTMLDLIKIDSPSGEEKEIAKELKGRFESLGGKVAVDRVGNLIARFDGEGEAILLSAHMDTVEPGRNIEPVVEGDVVRSAGETVLGADAKAGIAAILETLETTKEVKRRPIEVVLSVEEETGSKGAHGLDYSKLVAKKALVLDGDAQVFHINNSAPGRSTIDITITGRSAHAGLEPEKGISSIKIAAELINRLTLGRIDEETTTNIGLISGGSAVNAVPEKTEIHGEARSRNEKKLKEMEASFISAVEATRSVYPEAKIEYKLDQSLVGFKIAESDEFLQEIKKALEKVGLQVSFEPTGGGSDANYFNQHGIKAVVCGTGVRDLHTTKETLTISEMVQAAEFCEKLIKA